MTRAPSLKTRALGYLARREHSRLELEKKLARHAQTPEELSSMLDTLEQRGFLSAVRMVEHVVHIRRGRFGSQRIVHELREKGIAENLIAAVLPNIKETEKLDRPFGSPAGSNHSGNCDCGGCAGWLQSHEYHAHQRNKRLPRKF